MDDEKPIFEIDDDFELSDPDETPLKDRKVVTQPYDLSVTSVVSQINNGEIFLRPLNERPNFQRKYVWNNKLASRLVESILLNVPIPPIYLSQNEEFELDVIDGQQRLYSLYRFEDNQFALTGLDALKEFNGCRFHELPSKEQRKMKTHTLRCVLITNESHPEIKFDVFERLNSNTVPLNAQELRNCVHRGTLNELLGELVSGKDWLRILKKKAPDKRLRDEELVLRFFAFHELGLNTYRTPMKNWLNDASKCGRKFSADKIEELRDLWRNAIEVSLIWFDAEQCYRRPGSKALNRALFDLISQTAKATDPNVAHDARDGVRAAFDTLLMDEEFMDLISRAVDHKKRTERRFALWDQAMAGLL